MSDVIIVNGYLMVMGEEPDNFKGHVFKHLQERMEDAEACGWRSMRAYNTGWLQQLEQGRAIWGNGTKKLKLSRALV